MAATGVHKDWEMMVNCEFRECPDLLNCAVRDKPAVAPCREVAGQFAPLREYDDVLWFDVRNKAQGPPDKRIRVVTGLMNRMCVRLFRSEDQAAGQEQRHGILHRDAFSPNRSWETHESHAVRITSKPRLYKRGVTPSGAKQVTCTCWRDLARLGARFAGRFRQTGCRMINSRMPSDPNTAPSFDERLESWKEIAAYLKQGDRTVQRWERTEGLPVRRLGQDHTGFVFAYKAELDTWWQKQSRRLESQAEPETPSHDSNARTRWFTAALVTLVAIATGTIVWRQSSTTVTYQPIPITTDHGWETQPSFSPDGRQIAYVWAPPGEHPSIYVKTIDSEMRTRLTSGEQTEVGPAWSPDGRFVAFLRPIRPKQTTVLMLVPAVGGPENQIAELAAGGNQLSWSEDGQWLIAIEGPAKSQSLVAISIVTGAKHVLSKRSDFGYRLAAFSLDSRRVIFCPEGPGTTRAYEVDLGSDLMPRGEPRALTANFWARDFVAITPDAKQIVYTDDDLWEEGTGLWRLRLSGSAQPELLYGNSDRCFSPAISRDGRRVAFSVTRDYREDIWRKSLNAPDSAPTPLLSTTHSDLNPEYSPDGRLIAFHSKRTGRSDIWVAASDGTHPRRLTFTNARTTATPRWSPDGEWLAFESNQTGQSEVYVIHSAGGPLRRLTDDPAIDAIPSWSRDGHTIYFCSNRTGRYEVWKMPATGGAPTQVTYSGGFSAVESLDGKCLYYSQTRNYGPVWRMPLK